MEVWYSRLWNIWENKGSGGLGKATSSADPEMLYLQNGKMVPRHQLTGGKFIPSPAPVAAPMSSNSNEDTNKKIPTVSLRTLMGLR